MHECCDCDDGLCSTVSVGTCARALQSASGKLLASDIAPALRGRQVGTLAKSISALTMQK
eukprot:1190663-Pleurochrysis_carterae.AAC.7